MRRQVILDPVEIDCIVAGEAEFRTRIRAFLDEHAPLADDVDVWRRTLYEHGLLGVAWPREYGGGGLTKLEQVLREKGLPFESKIYPGQGHGFKGDEAKDALRRTVQFLDKHLKKTK